MWMRMEVLVVEVEVAAVAEEVDVAEAAAQTAGR